MVKILSLKNCIISLCFMKRNYWTRQAAHKAKEEAKEEAKEYLSRQENGGLKRNEIKKLYLALPYI